MTIVSPEKDVAVELIQNNRDQVHAPFDPYKMTALTRSTKTAHESVISAISLNRTLHGAHPAIGKVALYLPADEEALPEDGKTIQARSGGFGPDHESEWGILIRAVNSEQEEIEAERMATMRGGISPQLARAAELLVFTSVRTPRPDTLVSTGQSKVYIPASR